jgi:glycosyltransferase involved in cell wall biosynthesis
VVPELCVVVLNSHCYPQGGASRVAIDEAVGLANAGARVTFVGAIGPVCAELQNARLSVVCLEQTEYVTAGANLRVMLQGLWNTRAFRATRSLLGTLDARRTVVHLHSFTQALSSSPVRAALMSGFKIVCTLHDYFLACPNGAFFDYVERQHCTRRALSLNCLVANCDKRRRTHKLYRVVRAMAERTLGALPRGVRDYIAPSERSATMMRAYLPLGARLHFLENPLAVEAAPPVAVARNQAIVALGRLDIEKGIDVLLQAAARTGTPLTLVGDGPLRALAEAQGGCRITGWLRREAVGNELRKARCLVFPSLWRETYGLGVSEAAARGVPAIVSDLTAAAERVVDHVTGWHVRAGDVEDLMRCLHAIRDDQAVTAAGEAAYRHFWSDPPTLNNHVERLRMVYEKVLDSGG